VRRRCGLWEATSVAEAKLGWWVWLQVEAALVSASPRLGAVLPPHSRSGTAPTKGCWRRHGLWEATSVAEAKLGWWVWLQVEAALASASPRFGGGVVPSLAVGDRSYKEVLAPKRSWVDAPSPRLGQPTRSRVFPHFKTTVKPLDGSLVSLTPTLVRGGP